MMRATAAERTRPPRVWVTGRLRCGAVEEEAASTGSRKLPRRFQSVLDACGCSVAEHVRVQRRETLTSGSGTCGDVPSVPISVSMAPRGIGRTVHPIHHTQACVVLLMWISHHSCGAVVGELVEAWLVDMRQAGEGSRAGVSSEVGGSDAAAAQAHQAMAMAAAFQQLGGHTKSALVVPLLRLRCPFPASCLANPTVEGLGVEHPMVVCGGCVRDEALQWRLSDDLHRLLDDIVGRCVLYCAGAHRIHHHTCDCGGVTSSHTQEGVRKCRLCELTYGSSCCLLLGVWLAATVLDALSLA